jgi:hypothetical protein
MSELREALTEALNTCPGLSRQHGEKCADAVLRMLAEHGDTQQVREQLSVAIASAWYSTAGDPTVLDEVMTVVAQILAERDAAIEWAERVEADRKKRVAALKADLAAARQQLDQVHDDLVAILRALEIGGHARPISSHEVVVTEVLPAIEKMRQQFDQVWELHRNDGDGWCDNDGFSFPCLTIRLFDAPGPPGTTRRGQ